MLKAFSLLRPLTLDCKTEINVWLCEAQSNFELLKVLNEASECEAEKYFVMLRMSVEYKVMQQTYTAFLEETFDY